VDVGKDVDGELISCRGRGNAATARGGFVCAGRASMTIIGGELLGNDAAGGGRVFRLAQFSESGTPTSPITAQKMAATSAPRTLPRGRQRFSAEGRSEGVGRLLRCP